MAGVELLLVDPAVPLLELLGQHLDQLGASTDGLSKPSEAISWARERACNPPDMVLVDLEFPLSRLNGLDVMIAFKKWCPESRLIIYTAAGDHERQLFQVAWESICPASAVSKRSPVSKLIETVDNITRTGRADV